MESLYLNPAQLIYSVKIQLILSCKRYLTSQTIVLQLKQLMHFQLEQKAKLLYKCIAKDFCHQRDNLIYHRLFQFISILQLSPQIDSLENQLLYNLKSRDLIILLRKTPLEYYLTIRSYIYNH